MLANSVQLFFKLMKVLVVSMAYVHYLIADPTGSHGKSPVNGHYRGGDSTYSAVQIFWAGSVLWTLTIMSMCWIGASRRRKCIANSKKLVKFGLI